ncbi:16S rRNA (adenine(1518)-N(6)/adenine(1519)-N(6))-dimethyltransferase RsmA [Flocculibacter collagenilyticus]|uniref:16S rRNA (adenine(1518)-N(6)/adenine(1519)-N(6))- dimethyltransferase RsmA n=1 Tax=Flocculibacter collagenilyticus TaxID=2744479 RepID=UPI0018F67A4C|nr:16S rRNA (adenine(1518)-N(6)/adenine(1519)-N(6))-dimethyltransferase RsmA [Flocculibacter collagenilyticus]
MSDNVHLGHRARKRFGQNFLHDQSIINHIVAAINPQPDEVLVEIGPGLGAITEPVADLTNHLNVVELDKDLVERLNNHPELSKKLSVYQSDALKFDFSQLIPAEGKMKVFGNLPYNISTPLLFHLFNFADHIEHMHFMLQKEVVKRMAAAPGSKAFGRLSVMTQYYCNVIPVVDVPPECFKPAPKVDSAVVRLVPKPANELTAKSTKLLNQVCTEAFNMRRKTLRNCLKNIMTSEDLEALDISPSIRPESVSLQQFITIANWLHDKKEQ